VQESALVSVDSLWTGYTTHVFGLGYSYDLNGRRVGLRHPATVAPQGAGVRDSVRYGYDPDHGGLAWIEGLGTGSRYDLLKPVESMSCRRSRTPASAVSRSGLASTWMERLKSG
jgi:hypothetical protein